MGYSMKIEWKIFFKAVEAKILVREISYDNPSKKINRDGIYYPNK